MEIGNRLQAVAGLVRYPRVADVGADHGYLLLWLWQQGRLERGFACDVNAGPLRRAAENVARFSAGEAIATRLGSGLTPLAAGEADTAVLAGMGGMLMLSLLDEGREVALTLKQLVLQPQSDLPRVRQGLWERGFTIQNEVMAREGRRYYTALDVAPGREETPYTDQEVLYGRHLLARREPLLRDWLDWQISVKAAIPALAAECETLRRVRALWPEKA